MKHTKGEEMPITTMDKIDQEHAIPLRVGDIVFDDEYVYQDPEQLKDNFVGELRVALNGRVTEMHGRFYKSKLL